MKKNIFLLLFLGSIAYSQNYMTSLPFLIKKNGSSFSYVDKSTAEIYLFVANGKEVKIGHYDKKFNLINSLTTPIPDDRSDNVIGFTKSDSSINLIWASTNFNRLTFQNIDLVAKKTSFTSRDLGFSNQTALQTFSSNNIFYFLTLINNSSILRLYCFSNNNEASVKTINTEEIIFANSSNQNATIYELFAEEFSPFESSFELQNIDVTFPNSIAVCSKKRKAYLTDDELVLTFDNSPLSTQLIKINLKDFKHEGIKIDKPNGNTTNGSNSFLFENNLYQISLSSTNLSIDIKKLDGNIIQKLNTNLNDETNLKRSDFICEWVNPETEKNIGDMNQFINKLSKYSVGISCYGYKNKNLVSFGGVSKRVQKSNPDPENNAVYFPVNSGGAIGGFIAGTASFLWNRSNNLYYNYKSSRNIISANSLFSKDFQLESEKVNTYSGNKICHYFNGYSNLRFPTFFSNDEKAYIGYYSDESKQYVIMDFKN